MDDFSRNILVLSKKMLAELRGLSTRLLGIQEQIGSIRDLQEAESQQQHEQGRRPQILNAQLQIPEAAQHEKRASDKRHFTVQVVLAVVAFLAFLAAAIYAGINYRMLCEMRETLKTSRQANQATRDSLLYVQRAFIFVTTFDVTRLTSPNTNRLDGSMRFAFAWENGGSTPSRDMTEHISARWFDKPLPKDFAFPDYPDGPPFKMFVGPKATSRSTPIIIAAHDIISIHNHMGHLYLWGWARYNDVFPGTKQHITRFCTEITDVIGDPEGPSVNIQTSNCKENNCYDDECSNQKTYRGGGSGSAESRIPETLRLFLQMCVRSSAGSSIRSTARMGFALTPALRLPE